MELSDLLTIINMVVALLILPIIKFVFDMRLKLERLEIYINVIIKDVERLKKTLLEEKEEDNGSEN